MIRGWSPNVHSQWQCTYDKKSRKTLERNIHASQKEEHSSLLHDHTFPIKNYFKKVWETQTSCDAKHKTLSPAAQGQISSMHGAWTQHMLRVLQFTLWARIGLFIYHKYGRQLSEMSYSPFIAVRVILSLSDMNKDRRWRTKWETNYCSLSFALQCRNYRNSRSNFCHHWSLGFALPCSPTAAETETDELMVRAAHISSQLLSDSHSQLVLASLESIYSVKC